ncbi:peptidase C14 [Nostocales cyanobacterium HT-58-2]|nr:peptidase C14 [Nostocales cyanobacterium HT-58-2]
MGRNWAIAIGINKYNNLQSLNYAKQDAEAMRDWFEKEAAFDRVFLFTENSPEIPASPSPIPTQPTYGNLWRFLRANFEKPLLQPGDNLWFFFAGHGRHFADQDYLMLSDSDPQGVKETAISVDYVTQRLRRSGADNVVLFLDICRDQGNRMGLGIGEQRHQGVITFYSCTANQQSWEIEELQHGSFTHTLLQGLRLQGEANCATVERLEQHLRYQVPQLNVRYGKPVQHPYLQAEPPYKMYYILLEQSATLRDVQELKLQASLAENIGDWSLAEQLWVRVLAVSRADRDALDAIKRIARRQQLSTEPVISIPELVSTPGGDRAGISESTQESQIAQQAEAHRQNLVRYKQDFTRAIEREFPLSEVTRSQLKQLQQSLQLRDDEISQIEQPIIVQKEAEYRKHQEEERIRQQQEAERLRRQQQAEQMKQQEAERLRLQQEAEYRQKSQQYEQESNASSSQQAATITTPLRISRKRFLQLAGLGGTGLVTAVVGREIFKGQSPTPEPTNQPTNHPTNQRTNEPTTISVAAPKYIPPTEGGRKALGLPLWTVQFETLTVDEKGQVVKRHPDQQAKFFKEDLGNNVTLEMVSIPAGSFKMGSPQGEKERRENEGPQRTVNVPAFFMGRFEVTQEQYQQVMGKNPSYFKEKGAKRPVEKVSWNDAMDFCKKLSQKTGRTYRLPSEAEWEYACRAGTTTPFHFGETITTELANYDGNYTYASAPKGKYRQQTTEVGSFPPNAFGLYDMHGNVWEWCADTWHDSYEGAPVDGSAWIDNSEYRCLRGGSWYYFPSFCRSAYRDFSGRAVRDLIVSYVGFRVVCAFGRTS